VRILGNQTCKYIPEKEGHYDNSGMAIKGTPHRRKCKGHHLLLQSESQLLPKMGAGGGTGYGFFSRVGTKSDESLCRPAYRARPVRRTVMARKNVTRSRRAVNNGSESQRLAVVCASARNKKLSPCQNVNGEKEGGDLAPSKRLPRVTQQSTKLWESTSPPVRLGSVEENHLVSTRKQSWIGGGGGYTEV